MPARKKCKETQRGGDDTASEIDVSPAELEEPEIFQDLTAWFSTSVPKNRQKLWTDYGGKIADSESAMFVFSENPDSADTRRLYSSEMYLADHLAVFHSSYVAECVRTGPPRQICLGDFFLPPTETYKVLKQQNPNAFLYRWEELIDSRQAPPTMAPPSQNNGETSGHQTDHPSVGVATKKRRSQRIESPMETDDLNSRYVWVSQLPAAKTRAVREFVVGQDGAEVTLRTEGRREATLWCEGQQRR